MVAGGGEATVAVTAMTRGGGLETACGRAVEVAFGPVADALADGAGFAVTATSAVSLPGCVVVTVAAEVAAARADATLVSAPAAAAVAAGAYERPVCVKT